MADCLFRSGSTHSNHGRDALVMIKRAVAAIRKGYRADVPIIIRMDAGLFDQQIFDWCDAHGVGYIAGIEQGHWRRFDRRAQRWQYIQWGDRRGS